jgi:hypothetical protein
VPDNITPVGINPDVLIKHRSKYSAAQVDLREATAKNQAVLKAAKSDGVHIDALKFVYGLDKKDPLEAAAFMRAVLETGIILNCAFMTQSDMLQGGSIADLLKVPEPSDSSRKNLDLAMAHERGYAEGLHGGSLDNLASEFGAGTEALQAATKGFQRGVEFMNASLPKGVKAVKARTGGGRRDKSKETSNVVKLERPKGRPKAELPAVSEPIDMVRVQAMSNPEMTAYWNELTGESISRFESKSVGLSKFSQLYAAQQTEPEGASVN